MVSSQMALTSGGYWVTANTSSEEPAQALPAAKSTGAFGHRQPPTPLPPTVPSPEPDGCCRQQMIPLGWWEAARNPLNLGRGRAGLAETLGHGDLGGWPPVSGQFWGVCFGCPGSCLRLAPSARTPLGLVTVETKLARGGNAIPELIKVITASHQLLTRSKDLL